ncbi:MAG: hypothetical protein AAFV33_09805 [Chloroflexota bacterium]
MSFANFTTRFKDWLYSSTSDDLEAQTAFISTMAEARLNRDLRHREMQTEADLTFTPPAHAQLPADYLEAETVLYGESATNTTTRHRFVTVEQWEDYQSLNSGGCYFTIYGSEIRLHPTPTVVSTGTQFVRLRYFQKVPVFSTTDASWVYDRYPDLYLYACLAEGADYLRDIEQLPAYEAKYQKFLSDVMKDDQRQRYSGSRLVMRNPRDRIR